MRLVPTGHQTRSEQRARPDDESRGSREQTRDAEPLVLGVFFSLPIVFLMMVEPSFDVSIVTAIVAVVVSAGWRVRTRRSGFGVMAATEP
jgi:hypothetical protein